MTHGLSAKWNAIRPSKGTPPLVVFTNIQFNKKPENQTAYEQLFTEYKATLPENAPYLKVPKLGKLLFIYRNEATGMKYYMGGRGGKQKLFVEVTKTQHAKFTAPKPQHHGLDKDQIRSFLETTLSQSQCAELQSVQSILLDRPGRLIPHLSFIKRKSQGFSVHFQSKYPSYNRQKRELLNALFSQIQARNTDPSSQGISQYTLFENAQYRYTIQQKPGANATFGVIFKDPNEFAHYTILDDGASEYSNEPVPSDQLIEIHDERDFRSHTKKVREVLKYYFMKNLKVILLHAQSRARTPGVIYAWKII